MSKDYYKVLGIEKNATKDDVKKAFRKLAHQHHPDKGGDEAKFKEINEAYQILSDDSKRAQYDQFGASGGPGMGGFDFSQGFDFSNFGGEGVQFDLGDLFGDLFGGGGRQRTKRGRDISVDIQISLSEAIFGVSRTILISKVGACDTCGGSGAEPGSKTKSCGNCGGSGRIHDTKSTMFGTFTTTKTCDRCHGRGQTPEKECKSCGGRGIKPKQESVDIKVPAGIENGEMIRLSGRGEAVSQGVTGDLYVKVHVTSHPTIRREGVHLMYDLKIKLTDAVLGAEHKIETLDGETTIKIPAGINSGELLRIRGRGVPGRAGKRGDFLVRVIVPTPTKLSRSATDLFKKLKDGGV